MIDSALPLNNKHHQPDARHGSLAERSTALPESSSSRHMIALHEQSQKEERRAPYTVDLHTADRFLKLKTPLLSNPRLKQLDSPRTPSLASSASIGTPSEELLTPTFSNSMATAPPDDDLVENTKDSPPASEEPPAKKVAISQGKMRDHHWAPIDVRGPVYRDASPRDAKSEETASAEADAKPSLPPFARQSTNERLPGIASLDEHMSTPWRAGLAARRMEDEGPRSPFTGSTSIFHDRARISPDAQDAEMRYQRRGTATEPMSPRMSSYKRELPAFEGERRDAPAASPSARMSIDEQETDPYAPSPGFVHPSSFSRRSTYNDEDPYASRWGKDDRGPMSAARQQPGDTSSYRAPTVQSNSLRTRSLGNWKVGSHDEGGALRRDSYRIAVPPLGSRGSAPTTTSTSTSYDYPHRPSASSSIYDSSDDRSSTYDEVARSSPRHHPYAHPGRISPATTSSDPHAAATDDNSPGSSRRRGKLPKAVTDMLKQWLLEHASHPYPTEDEKKRLCDATGLSMSQVSNWFINARRRILVPTTASTVNVGMAPGAMGAPASRGMPGHALPSGYAPVSSYGGEARYGASRYPHGPQSGPLPPHYYRDSRPSAHEHDAYQTQRHPSWHSELPTRYSRDAPPLPPPGSSYYGHPRP